MRKTMFAFRQSGPDSGRSAGVGWPPIPTPPLPMKSSLKSMKRFST
jgi:hypothetical protein